MGEVYRVIRRAGCPGVELFHGYGSTRDWGHYNGVIAFGSSIDWQGKVAYRRQVRDLAAGGTFLHEPGEFFQAEPHTRDPASFKVIEIQPEVFLAACRAEGHEAPVHFSPSVTFAPPVLERAIAALHRSFIEDAEPLELEARIAALAHAAMTTVMEAPRQHSFENAAAIGPCQRLREILHSADASKVTLSALACDMKVSPFQLLRAFKRRYGVTPHAYALHVRVERARNLLRTGCSVAEAAAAEGFADQSHLTRHYRRIWPLTPGKYAATPRVDLATAR